MAEKHHSFVFYDPTGQRWIRIRRGLQTGAIFLGLAVLLLGLTLAISPQLPALGFKPVESLGSLQDVRQIISGERAVRNVPFRMRRAAKNLKYVRSVSPVVHPRQAAHAAEGQPVVFGYYVNWDPSSIVSLRLNVAHLTHLVPEWLILTNDRGDLDDQSDPVVIEIARQAKLPILALVTNFHDGWQPGNVRRILESAERRANLIDNIYHNLTEHHFAGVNIDFELLARRDRDLLVVFLEELRAKLNPAGLLLTQSVPPDDPAYDLKRLAAVNDYLVPMVYDEHYQSGAPGPVASEGWFQDQLERLAKQVPPEKTVIGVGSYGYDWVIGGSGGAETVYGDVMSAALLHQGTIEFDRDAVNPVLRYRDGAGQHEVWFLDAVTGLNHTIDVSDAGFRGIGLWRLGAEDPGLWTVLKPGVWPDDGFDPNLLSLLTATRSVIRTGEGDLLRITRTPSDGRRTVTRNSDGDYEERYEALPSYYVMENTHRVPKTLALSFDDGPDGRFTPKILDILKSRQVPGTFFVVGVNAERYPELIRRAYAEGHEIGNHTYSHPNIALVSEERNRLELSTTLRIVENAVGHATMLFRPPYNADSEPQTPGEIIPIYRAQQAGYLTVGERIDPRDWDRDMTAQKIVEEVESERDSGNIILLHDAGGDRTATVEALPRIIDDLKAMGYRFVAVSALMGKTRDEVMPVPDAGEMRLARIEGQAFGAQSSFKNLIGVLFLWAIYLTLLRSLVFGTLAVFQKRKARRRHFDADYRPPVSVIIAAYNEEKVILRTVHSILDNGYADLEVVVVDDGSTDGTLAVLRENFGDDRRARILTQPNGGKSAALNHAIAHSSREILIALDADTIFRRGTIEKLVRHFRDPRIGAVSGNARVGNRGKWITRFQSIEYIYGFNLDRRALDLLNAITVVPGAVGAWRRELVAEAGGFVHDTLAEDTDLTLTIRRRGYTIRYEEEAVAYTEAPEDTRSLAKQRFRWAFGTLQAAWKHRDALFVPKYG
ncbi:MAG TPA: glycosyltransferase, partial [Bryobacteraceae bacterium]|nr:glycosyltransferase [Bryobacteraceae bacterium]